MHLNILIGCGLVVVTTAIHVTAMVVAFRGLRLRDARRWAGASGVMRAAVVAAVVLVMFGASIVEAALWAATYLAVGAMSGFERAIYFSTVTYTTLGYGDIVLDEGWRLLSSLQAANGIIMFGLTTAIIVASVQRVYAAHGESGGRE